MLFNKNKTALIQYPGGKQGAYSIPNSVTNIKMRAFSYCSGLTSISIPSSVTTIGEGAFGGCTGLTEVTLSAGIQQIRDYAFGGCTQLMSISIPSSVTDIWDGAFDDIPNIYYHGTLDGAPWGAKCVNGYVDGVLVYSDYSKDYLVACSRGATGSIDISQSVDTIGEAAFRGCTGLTNVRIPDGVKTIADYAFYGCTGLISLTIPNSVDSIGEDAFSDVLNVVYNGEASGATWGARCYNAFVDGLLVYSDDTKTELIGCSPSIKGAVTIPNTVKTIGYRAFDECSDLTSITIPNSVTSIGYEAFDGCTGLTSITIPNSVTSIAYDAFRRCTGLKSIIVETGNTVYDSRNGCNAIINTSSNQLMFGCQNTIIPKGVTSIGDDAFQDCTGLTNITIPDGVTSIGSNAFQSCSGLTTVTIPDGVTSIGSNAFSGCSALTNITIPNSVTEISDAAFSYSGLTSVTLPSDLKAIESATFAECSNLKQVVIPNGVTEIGAYAFERCSNLTNVTIPDGVTTIGYNAFYWCEGITSITIPNTVTEIGEDAFSDVLNVVYNGEAIGAPWGARNYNLYNEGYLLYADKNKTKVVKCNEIATGDIILPNSVKTIAGMAFWDCSNITSITIPNSVDSIGRQVFQDCFGLTTPIFNDHLFACLPTSYEGKYSVKEGIQVVCSDAFNGCSKLTDISLPNSLKELGTGAFWGCSSLDTIFIPKGVKTMASSALWAVEAVERPVDDEVFISNLQAIIVDKDNPYYTSIDGILYDKNVKTLIQYPTAKVMAYTIPEGVDSIGPGACEGACITELTIPGTVTAIGSFAFMYCRAKTIRILEGITEIGNKEGEEGTFSACMRLENLFLPNSLTKIGPGAFESCVNIRELILGSNIKEIGESAFTLDVAKCYNITCLAEKMPTCPVYRAGELPIALYKKDHYNDEYGYWRYSEAKPSILNVYVPYASVGAYKADDKWGQYTILPIQSQQVTVTEVHIVPAQNSAEVSWPSVAGANSYELAIKDKEGSVICTLIFNAQGQLTQLILKTPSKNHSTQQLQATGFQFTVTGLNENTAYDYTITSKDENGQVIDTKSGSFETISSSTETFTINFVNWDGMELLKLTGVTKGTTPVYSGETPTRPEDESYTYTFTGWTPDIVAASANATYTAKYDAIKKAQDFDSVTDPENQKSKIKNQKMLKNGILLILRDGVFYNAQGARVE